MAVVYTLNLFIELLIGAWYISIGFSYHTESSKNVGCRLYLPRDGLELLNGRGIFFGLTSTRFEQEYQKLFSGSASSSSSSAFPSAEEDRTYGSSPELHISGAPSGKKGQYDPYNNL